MAINLVRPQQLVHFAFRPQLRGALGRGGRIGQPGVAEPDYLVPRRPVVLAVQVAANRGDQAETMIEVTTRPDASQARALKLLKDIAAM
ncbi:MAG: hypothetical protein OXC26_24170 [Albidovulum sp.]|nr:hypothetical protein [Albidovulum sp.]